MAEQTPRAFSLRRHQRDVPKRVGTTPSTKARPGMASRGNNWSVSPQRRHPPKRNARRRVALLLTESDRTPAVTGGLVGRLLSILRPSAVRRSGAGLMVMLW